MNLAAETKKIATRLTELDLAATEAFTAYQRAVVQIEDERRKLHARLHAFADIGKEQQKP